MRKAQEHSFLERITIVITRGMGTTTSIIIHSALFAGIFLLYFAGFALEQILLILTTAVSLEAIYLSLLIQMTVNRNTESLEEVEEDINEIQEDVEEVEEDIDELQKDVEDISEDVEGVEGNIGDIQEEVEDISEDIEKIQESPKKSNLATVSIYEQLEIITKELTEIKKELKNNKK